jgi:hypothetical protein
MKNSIILIALLSVLPGACSDPKKKTENNNNQDQWLDHTQILQACLIRDACDVMPVGYISPCVTAHYDQVALENQQGIWNEVYKCVLASGGSCTTVKECFGNGALPATCDPSTQPGRCEGDVRYWCDSFNREMYAMNCRDAGMTCVVGDDGTPQCTLNSCDTATYSPICDGDRQRLCDNGYINTVDCTVLGLPCTRLQTDEDVWQTFCMDDGGQCDPTEYEGTCEGNIKNDCSGLGVVQRIDCSQLPGDKTCEMTVNGPACNAAGTECGLGEEGCLDDFTARVCLDGTWQMVDCRTLGFTRCTGRGAARDIGAHCTR